MAEPETATLEAFYNSRLDDYTLPTRYSFRQLYFTDQSAANDALETITGGEEATGFGENSMLSANYAYRSALDLNANFGAGFAEQLRDSAPGSWQGPVRSDFGFHLIFITSIHPQEVTPFAAITQQLLIDYGQYQQQNARRLYLQNLLNEYDIVVETR